MKTSEILNLDFRKVENKIIIRKALGKIDGLLNCEMESLEKYIYECEKEYSMMINYICPTFVKNIPRRYCATIKDKITSEITDYVWATCIYELYAKICILYYSKIKSSKCKKV